MNSIKHNYKIIQNSVELEEIYNELTSFVDKFSIHLKYTMHPSLIRERLLYERICIIIICCNNKIIAYAAFEINNTDYKLRLSVKNLFSVKLKQADLIGDIIVNDKYVVHYCMEPVNISSLSDEEKLAAIYYSPGDSVKKGQIVCKMIGGPGHLDWGLIKDNERICPACYLPDTEYDSINTFFKSLPGSYEGYENLCPDNSYHTNPRQ